MCELCTQAIHSVALWTRVTLGCMCKVCTEAVHSVALWTRVTLGLDVCEVCTEAVHSVALWTRVTLGLDMCKRSFEGWRMVIFKIPLKGWNLWRDLQKDLKGTFESCRPFEDTFEDVLKVPFKGSLAFLGRAAASPSHSHPRLKQLSYRPDPCGHPNSSTRKWQGVGTE